MCLVMQELWLLVSVVTLKRAFAHMQYLNICILPKSHVLAQMYLKYHYCVKVISMYFYISDGEGFS